MRRRFLSSTTLGLALALGVLGRAGSTGPAWTYVVVDPAGNHDPDATEGTAGPSIAYAATTTVASIRFAYESGSTWRVETVDANGVSAIGALPQLGIDQTGIAWVLYRRVGFHDMPLRYRLGSQSWVQAVTVEGATPQDLAIAPDGSIGLLYLDGDNALIYATWDGSVLTTSVVAATANEASLAYGPVPGVALADAGRQLVYAELAGDEWQTTIVDQARQIGSPSLAFRFPGRPAIAYRDLDGSDLRGAVRTGAGVWLTRPIDRTGNTGLEPSLAFATTGDSFIAFARNPSDLRLAHRTGAGGSIETIFTDFGLPGGGPSLAIAPDGTPHVAFMGDDGLRWSSP